MSADTLIRINRFLAQAGLGSRRGVEAAIGEGRVSINGKLLTEMGVKVDPVKDTVLFDDKQVKPEKRAIYIFNKPDKVISTLSDPQGRPCVADFLEEFSVRLVPAGRLDYDVSGLLLMTNDGDYINKLLHPSFEVPRTYLAEVSPIPNANLLKRLIKGVELEDGFGKATEAKIPTVSRLKDADLSGRPVVEVTVTEGRNHFVKRLFSACGHPVKKLVRVEFGPYKLSNLKIGRFKKVEFRELS